MHTVRMMVHPRVHMKFATGNCPIRKFSKYSFILYASTFACVELGRATILFKFNDKHITDLFLIASLTRFNYGCCEIGGA